MVDALNLVGLNFTNIPSPLIYALRLTNLQAELPTLASPVVPAMLSAIIVFVLIDEGSHVRKLLVIGLELSYHNLANHLVHLHVHITLPS